MIVITMLNFLMVSILCDFFIMVWVICTYTCVHAYMHACLHVCAGDQILGLGYAKQMFNYRLRPKPSIEFLGSINLKLLNNYNVNEELSLPRNLNLNYFPNT